MGNLAYRMEVRFCLYYPLKSLFIFRLYHIQAFNKKISEYTMKGTRPLDNDEIRRVSTCFTGTFAIRNRGLFMLGVSTGGRISELLSLEIGDVYQNGSAVTDLLFEKNIVKAVRYREPYLSTETAEKRLRR